MLGENKMKKILIPFLIALLFYCAPCAYPQLPEQTASWSKENILQSEIIDKIYNGIAKIKNKYAILYSFDKNSKNTGKEKNIDFRVSHPDGNVNSDDRIHIYFLTKNNALRYSTTPLKRFYINEISNDLIVRTWFDDRLVRDDLNIEILNIVEKSLQGCSYTGEVTDEATGRKIKTQVSKTQVSDIEM